MCCRHSRIVATGAQTRNLGTSREERTNPSLPPKKTQKEKELKKNIRVKNNERQIRRRKTVQKEMLNDSGKEGLARIMADHQEMRDSVN